MVINSIWIIALVAIAGIIIRPYNVPEYVWAIAGAVLLLVLGMLTPAEALEGVRKGTDVYLFLTGMMLLAETARDQGLFDWLAVQATNQADGSANRLFGLVYLVGIVVTAFLSNDATAVVLTPAVAAAVKAADVKKPLPYLFICAFIANAASFVLPISNPANLVIYGTHMPSLMHWLAQYGLPSVVSIGITYAVLRFTQQASLQGNVACNIPVPTLSTGGRMALMGIALTALVLLGASAMDAELGLPTAVAGILTSVVVMVKTRTNPWSVIKQVSWSVLPLVAGLFVLVEGLNKTGLVDQLAALLQQEIARSVTQAAWLSGVGLALVCNLMNNLPAGLIVGSVVQTGAIPDMIKSFLLIGIDLGPNLSVTGSLATILWLVALRREGIQVSAWEFLKLGIPVMLIALLASLAVVWVQYQVS
ncbi:arsenic transporter [Spirosoma sp. KUDC1026]|uniref:arsenic transporter n=1 Tax=Spirosoma sp. KUDC1026 TaxID=2745947 RepID=UPI00159B9F06|nr:arsenic transporter [Spirosoma sp. KUDC1026]QKZ14184.1 arsenic transporter [Spirosoma sp. KUDC1026]